MTDPILHCEQPPRLRRGGFLLLSLAIHLGLLAVWQGETLLQFGQSDGRHTSTVLHAVLAPAPAAEKKAAPEPVTPEPQRSAHTPTQPDNPNRSSTHPAAPTQRQTQQQMSEHAGAEIQRKTPGKSSVADSQRAALEKRALGKIRIELARHFQYPRQAVRLGWQGEVLLRFRLTSSGHIEAVQVASSSGYSVLDSAAVRALRDVRQIGQVMDHHSDSIDLQLPIIYRLQES